MGPRVITYTDYERLMLMLERDVQDHTVQPDAMHRLYLILETSFKTESEAVNVNTITMNTRFLIRSIQTGACKERTLVYPDKSFESEPLEYVNIYDPLGLSVLGYRQNDIIDLYKIAQNGKPNDRFVIEKVLFQPEAMQLFNL
jgi:regulator of nucleoside diphosphate kinase